MTSHSLSEALTSMLQKCQQLEQVDRKQWTGADVTEAADMVLPPPDQERLSALLDSQQARSLTSKERTDLATMIEIYQACQLVKAHGMMEAQSRGLRNYPKP